MLLCSIFCSLLLLSCTKDPSLGMYECDENGELKLLPATVILEAHDVWGDGSGYQLLLDADATAYGNIIPAVDPLTSSGNASTDTYAVFEYRIPENANGILTTSNIVLDGTSQITIPAGTYDYCITNPLPGDRMWIANGVYGRGDNFEFNDGYTYHFTISKSGDRDFVHLETFPTPIQ